MKSIELVSVNCCGEVGDVIVNGVEPPQGSTVFEQAEFIKQDKKLWKYVLNEPRGGVFKHVNLIVPPKDPAADMGFIIMEPADVPPMSGSNSICVATVLLEKGIIPITNSTMNLTLEAPGGLINVEAKCNEQKVESVTITNFASFVLDFEKEIKQGQDDFLNRLREIDERELKIELEEERIRKKIMYDRIGCCFMCL